MKAEEEPEDDCCGKFNRFGVPVIVCLLIVCVIGGMYGILSGKVSLLKNDDGTKITDESITGKRCGDDCSKCEFAATCDN
jgi:hypothetical protein